MRHALAWALLHVSVAGCYTGPEGREEGDALRGDDAAIGMHELRDDVVGVELRIPEGWAVQADEVRFDGGYGFMIYGPDRNPDEVRPHDREVVARVTRSSLQGELALEQAVATKIEQYAEFPLEVEELELPDGTPATTITGLPGVMPYSVVYADSPSGLYEIGLWSEEEGIDSRGRELLESLSFHEPTESVDALELPTAEDALYAEPPGDLAARSKTQAQDRAATLELALELDEDLEEDRGVDELAFGGNSAASCGFTAPKKFMWQLQWDNTNAFYSGDWYNLRDKPGWSAMSGNYGSWWGQGFHVRKCSNYYLNQHYANDWPAYYWDNIYAPFNGTVEWAGWGTDGFASLGRYVVVRKNGYRSLSAHLIAIRKGIKWGAKVGLATVIGYAGDTGEYYAGANWAPHLHARIGYGEKLTYNGQPYGGQSVRPRRLRCWTCGNPDINRPTGGLYNKFWHGRWMRH